MNADWVDRVPKRSGIFICVDLLAATSRFGLGDRVRMAYHAWKPLPRRRDGEAMDVAALRILEIGNYAVFKHAYPANTLLLWSSVTRLDAPRPGERNLGFRSLRLLWRAIRRREFDLIVCYPPRFAPWELHWLARLAGKSWVVLLPEALLRTLAPHLLRFARDVPIVLIDIDDTPSIGWHTLPLIRRSRLFFKRELPADHWRVFHGTVHRDLPSSRIRRNPDLDACLAKLRPISLGISEDKLARIGQPTGEKTMDIFFAGKLAGSSHVRRRGVEQLRGLARQGLSVDIVSETLPFEDYAARCARAWLTWAPEGFGWDTFRQYEAAACESVPVMNVPPTDRYAPLRDGQHCFWYDVAGDHLVEVVRGALADKPRLRRMGQAARAHVLRYHAHRQICRYVVEACLGGG